MNERALPDFLSGLFPNPAAHQEVTVWFLRALGLVSFFAFWSVFTQLSGLAGPEGLAPSDLFAERIHTTFAEHALEEIATSEVELSEVQIRMIEARATFKKWLSFPALGLLGDFALLRGLCIAGIVASLLLVFVRLPWLCLLVCWLCYLSICCLVQPFMNFQWDALLLETLFVSLFLVPILAWKGGGAPRVAGLFLLRLLLLKLMFSSGIVKLSFGDPTWWNFAALDAHYQTQPLPMPTAWFAHHLPDWLHRVALLQMFVVEIVFALLVFAGRRPRQVAAAGILLLQLLIAITGNYTFFNLLTAVLCIPLLDDRMLGVGAVQPASDVDGKKVAANPVAADVVPAAARPEFLRSRRVAWVVAGFIAVLSLLQTLSAAAPNGGHGSVLRKPIAAMIGPVAGFRSINEYGLFRVMTTSRPELVIEGSHDGKVWRPYDFRYKPGPVDRMPVAVAPHQPRLDWQMWFEALAWESTLQRRQRPVPSLWLQRLAQGMFDENPQVLALLRHNPFAGKCPEFIRFRLVRYQFTTPEERAASGHWWRVSALSDIGVVLRRPKEP